MNSGFPNAAIDINLADFDVPLGLWPGQPWPDMLFLVAMDIKIL